MVNERSELDKARGRLQAARVFEWFHGGGFCIECRQPKSGSLSGHLPGCVAKARIDAYAREVAEMEEVT